MPHAAVLCQYSRVTGRLVLWASAEIMATTVFLRRRAGLTCHQRHYLPQIPRETHCCGKDRRIILIFLICICIVIAHSTTHRLILQAFRPSNKEISCHKVTMMFNCQCGHYSMKGSEDKYIFV